MKIQSTDSWAVFSPGRTGSMVIVATIRNLYHEQNSKLYYVPPDKTLPMTTIRNGKIIHSHSTDFYLKIKNTDTHCVISTRNMVESALSWIIQPYIGKWHIYNLNQINNIRISKINFDYSLFMKMYTYTKEWYNNIRSIIGNSIIIDYEEFKHDTPVIISKLKIDYNGPTDKFILPIKNPGTMNEWFNNWDSVLDKISKLETTPPLN